MRFDVFLQARQLLMYRVYLRLLAAPIPEPVYISSVLDSRVYDKLIEPYLSFLYTEDLVKFRDNCRLSRISKRGPPNAHANE